MNIPAHKYVGPNPPGQIVAPVGAPYVTNQEKTLLHSIIEWEEDDQRTSDYAAGYDEGYSRGYAAGMSAAIGMM